jgi:hypothetical protein
MSTVDEHEKDIPSEESGGESPSPPAPEQKGKAAAYVVFFFFIGLIASLIVGWIIFPQLLYSQKKQPIDFNHALHTGLTGDCSSCHYFRTDGTFSGVPTIWACMDCHEEVQGEDPEEEKFVTEYVWEYKEVPWLVYSRQPDCVFFSHAAHVLKAEMDCVTCHGPVGESEHTRVYEENRITGYSRDIWGRNISGFKRNSWDRMKMDDCADCHAEARDTASREEVTEPLGRLIDNVLRVGFPGTVSSTKGGSVQTQRGACFKCHK